MFVVRLVLQLGATLDSPARLMAALLKQGAAAPSSSSLSLWAAAALRFLATPTVCLAAVASAVMLPLWLHVLFVCLHTVRAGTLPAHQGSCSW